MEFMIIGIDIGILIVIFTLEPEKIRQCRHFVLPMTVAAVMMMAIVLFTG